MTDESSKKAALDAIQEIVNKQAIKVTKNIQGPHQQGSVVMVFLDVAGCQVVGVVGTPEYHELARLVGKTVNDYLNKRYPSHNSTCEEYIMDIDKNEIIPPTELN